MKKTKSVFGLFVICFAIVLALAVWAGINPPVSVSAEMVGSFVEYTVEDFRMEMKIAENRTISVKERLTVNFPGRNGHGIIRDFPLGGGIVYNNISAECETSTDFSPYFKSDDLSFLSYYLGGEGSSM